MCVVVLSSGPLLWAERGVGRVGVPPTPCALLVWQYAGKQAICREKQAFTACREKQPQDPCTEHTISIVSGGVCVCGARENVEGA